MRRNITISLDQRFIELMDARRGSIPRSRWLEAQADPEHSAPIIEPVSRESIASEAVGPDDAFEPPALNKYGDPLDTVYDETDPRSWT